MSSTQKRGGVAALIMAATFVVGFMVFGSILIPAGYLEPGVDPVRKVAILAENHTLLSISYLTSYVVFGIFLVVLALAIYDRLKPRAPALAQIGTAFGLLWAGLVIGSGMVANVGMGTVVDLFATDPAQAGAAWLAIEAVQLGLGGGNEIVGGVWVLLVSWGALQAGEFGRVLNYLGGVIGVAGLLTVIPALEVFGPLFGLGLILWFVWLGIVMLRSGTRPAMSV